MIVRWAMGNQAESDDSRLLLLTLLIASGLNVTFEQLLPSLFPPNVNHWLSHILADSFGPAVE